jgi:uncharacterized protein involved in exopolysaccharide biosynthesis
MKLLLFLALSVALLAGCESRTPIYRANVKLLITHPDATTTANDEDQFVATQKDILSSQLLLHRTEQRMNKTAEEVRDNLADLKVTPIRGSNIIVVSVDSPSPDFAKDFGNALVAEYLKFRDEQRVKISQDDLSPLTHEVQRLKGELEAANEKLDAFQREHGISTNAQSPEFQALFENREEMQKLYDALLAQSVKANATQFSRDRNVSLLDPAILEPNRVH